MRSNRIGATNKNEFNMFWIFTIIIALMIFGCYVTYKEARHHELHKMRAAFEDRHIAIEKMMSDGSEKDDKVNGFLEGELCEINKSIKLLEEEGVEEDLIDDIKKDLEVVNSKIKNLFK